MPSLPSPELIAVVVGVIMVGLEATMRRPRWRWWALFWAVGALVFFATAQP